MILFIDEIKTLLKNIDSTIEFDLYIFICNLIKNSTDKKISFNISDFQVETSRKSKGIIHIVDAITSMNYNTCLFQSFDRLGDKIIISNPNYDYDREMRGFTKYETSEIYTLNTISEKKLFIYLKSIQYKVIFSFKLDYLKALNIKCNIYRLNSFIKQFGIIQTITKKSDTELEILFNDVETKSLFRNKTENKTVNKINAFAHRFDSNPNVTKSETENKNIEIPTELQDISSEIISLLGKSYDEFSHRFETSEFYQKSGKIYITALRYNIQWIKDNRFDKKILHGLNQTRNETIFTDVVFVEKAS